MDTLMNIGYVLLAAGLLVLGFKMYQSRRQRPLAELGKGKVHLALRFAPEQQAKVEKRGSMSQYELTQLLKLNLRRVDAELQRRRATA